MICKTEVYIKEAEVTDYVRDYYEPARFLPLCKECRQYGRRWTCPPFGKAPAVFDYKKVTLIATKIYPAERDIPIDAADALMLPVRRRTEEILQEMEKLFGGYASSNVGECLHCPPGECTRPEGKPCRHPELIRPSLEAYGFDLVRTLTDLFGIEPKWSRDGLVPEYLTLVCAFFHNRDSAAAELSARLTQPL